MKLLIKWLNPFKTLFIWVLVILAIYQTSQLWFVNITSRSFFFKRNPFVYAVYEVSDIVRPYRIVIGAGDGLFAMLYGKTAQTDAAAYGDIIFTELLRGGEFLKEGEVNHQDLQTRTVYLYEYAFYMQAEVFAQGHGWKPAVLANRGVNKFHSAAIFPPDVEGEKTLVCFYNDEAMWEYSVDIDIDQSTPELGEGTALYDWNGVPENPPPGTVEWHNPYTNDYGEKLLDFIKTRIALFFDNPATINEKMSVDGVYTFSTINTVVRYYHQDILTYASYGAVDISASPDILTDYNAAIAFIEADIHMKNEFYLAGYSFEDERHHFRFNFIVDGQPLVMFDDAQEHHIEIMVERGTVLKYRKLVYNFFIS